MVSLILPVYPIDDEVSRYARECINRIQEFCSKEDYELIVVQNGGDESICSRSTCVEILVEVENPLGFAKALNMGAKLATGDYIGLVSADVMIQDYDYLPSLLDGLNSHPEFGAAIPVDMNSPVQGVQIDGVWGAAWIVKRWMFERLGGHNVDLNHRLSDQDFWIRMVLSGYHPVLWGGVRVVHHEGSTVFKMPDHTVVTEHEYSIMLQRYGYRHFHEWLAANPNRAFSWTKGISHTNLHP